MKTRMILFAILVLSVLSVTGYGWATEHIGPLGPEKSTQVRFGENSQPKGIDTLQKHPARVYSRWVNGREDIYYSVDVKQANELLAMFAKLPLENHHCLIDAQTEGLACTFKQQDIRYNMCLANPQGIYLHKAQEEDDIIDWPTEAQLILTGSQAKELSAKLDIPKNVKMIDKETYSKEKTDDTAEMIVKGNTNFAFDLYAQLKTEEGNLFFSPYSISTALAMTYAGARGETEKQIAKTLHFPVVPYFDSDPFQRGYCNLIKQLNAQGQKGDYQLLIANALWAQKDYPFRSIPEGFESFLGWVNNGYKAGLENVDFINETEKTRKKINQWVEDKTNDKIKDLIPQGALNPMTRLVLTNAIYFKGDWAEQFDKDDTENADFFVSPDKTVKTPLMFQKEEFLYAENDLLQILQLSYKGDDLSMLVLLPKDKNGLGKLEKELTPANMARWQKQLHKKEVLVYLPKFKMTSEFSLSETLEKMGMPDAFDIGKADFSGMTGNKDLFISAVLHKAFVEVNEKGTEAAAATGAMMELSAELGEPPVFRADHPFIFLIKDNKTGSILFVGRVVDPTKEKE